MHEWAMGIALRAGSGPQGTAVTGDDPEPVHSWLPSRLAQARLGPGTGSRARGVKPARRGTGLLIGDAQVQVRSRPSEGGETEVGDK
jgi:hypothetical protein